MHFDESSYEVDEDAGFVSICVDSGVTNGFETTLTVTLSASDGKASEFKLSSSSLSDMYIHWLFRHGQFYISPRIILGDM